LDIHLNQDELTSVTDIKITDFSEMDDNVGLNEMWDNFMQTLREKVAG